jgi:hypothetical protein
MYTIEAEYYTASETLDLEISNEFVHVRLTNLYTSWSDLLAFVTGETFTMFYEGGDENDYCFIHDEDMLRINTNYLATEGYMTCITLPFSPADFKQFANSITRITTIKEKQH